MPGPPGRLGLLTTRIATLDQLVAKAAEPFEPVIARLMTIPGIGQRIAQVIVAGTGGDMARFTSSARLAARAGLAPGGNESAGKRKKAAARKGNPHLRAAMAGGAWAVSRTASRPGARFRRLTHRFGRLNIKKAAVAAAHTLLCIAWAVMKHDSDYAEAGSATTTSGTSATTSISSATTSRPSPGSATRSL